MKITLDRKTLTRIIDFNPIDNISDLSYYTRQDMQYVLIISAYTDYLKSLGLLVDLDLEIKE